MSLRGVTEILINIHGIYVNIRTNLRCLKIYDVVDACMNHMTVEKKRWLTLIVNPYSHLKKNLFSIVYIVFMFNK